MRTPKTALVISGGGSKGAFAVGVVRELYERFRSEGWFSIVGGSSTGALIAPFAALLAAEQDVAAEVLAELVTTYSTVRTRDILERHGPVESIVRRDSLNETHPLREIIESALTPERFAMLQRRDMPVAFVVYTNFTTGKSVYVSSRDHGVGREHFINAMLASASVPVIMEAAIIEGDICYDGGTREILPMMQAVELGAEVVVPVMLDPAMLPPPRHDLSRLDRVLFRSVAIMLDEILVNDYEQARTIQRAVRMRESLRKSFGRWPWQRRRLERILRDPEFAPLVGESRQLRRIVAGIRPPGPMTDDALRFEPERMRAWIEQGAELARTVLERSPFEAVR
jgi:predicted acylesterase/phospholipase RssA